jgi:PAS domain S-box-containing protein
MAVDTGIKKLVMIFIIFSFVVSASIMLIEKLYFKQTIQKVALKNAIDRADERERYIQQFLDDSKKSITTVRKSVYFENYLQNKHDIHSLEKFFLIFSQANQNFMQLRYLDVNGNEIVRVDRKNLGEKAKLIQKESLQNKSDRYYFADSKMKTLDEIWFSVIDLNKENGKIEVPHKSTLRVIMPINKENKFAGILIINYFMQEFISRLTSTPSFDMAIFDDKGYTISHFDHQKDNHTKCWGNILDHKYNISNDFPNHYKKILNSHFLYEDTFVYKKLSLPIDGGLNLILQLKKPYLQELENQNEMNYFITSVLVFIISLLLTYGVVKLYSIKLLNIEHQNKLLDELNLRSNELEEKTQLLSEKNNELEESEQELTIVNENLELILASKTDDIKKREEILSRYVIYSRTDLKGIITDASEAFCKLSGYSKEELLGNPHSIIRHEDVSSATYKELWETIKNGNSWQGELKNRSKDGSYYWVFSDISPEYDHTGHLLGYISIRSDITDRKEFELQQIHLMEQSKMASMGEMIGNIAHQWRQPLTTISTKATGSIFQKEMGLLSDEVFNENMESINENAQYLSQTIDIFRNFLKGNKPVMELSIVNEINNSLKIVEGTLKNYDIHTKLELSDDELMVTATEGELSQVIINILNNAKDALLENKIDEKNIVIKLYKEDTKAIITIEDNAGGIPDDVMPRIFEPYFTTKHQSQGTGLGLQMSYSIVTDSFKGKLYAKNTVQGAKFYIELPLEG